MDEKKKTGQFSLEEFIVFISDFSLEAFIYDQNANIIFANTLFYQRFPDLKNQTNLLSTFFADNFSQMALNKNQTTSSQTTVKRKNIIDGRWDQITLSPILLRNKSPYFLAIINDITTQKKLESELKNKNALLEVQYEELQLKQDELLRQNTIIRQQEQELSFQNTELKKNKIELNTILRDLRKSQENYRKLFLYMDEAVTINELVYDENDQAVDFKKIDVNPAYETLFNVKREIIVNKLVSDCYGWKKPPFLPVISKVIETGEPQIVHSHFVELDRYFQVMICPIGGNRFACHIKELTVNDINEINFVIIPVITQ